jgi:enoyl-CoA hydratase/carnithine racemase
MSAAVPQRVRIERIPCETRGDIAHLTIDHAGKANALDSELLEELACAFEDLAGEPDIRAAVLAGAGERSFIAGANIAEMQGLDAASARAFILRVHRVCRAIRDLPVPVVARIQGVAFGAGVEIAAACDFRIAADLATFGMPEVRIGIPSVVEAALLPQLVGWGRTRWLLLTGETIDAATALQWGLVEFVVPVAALDEAVARSVHAITVSGPQAIRNQKRLIHDWERLPLDQAIAAGVDAFADAWSTDEPRRMMAEALAALRRR